MKRVPLVDRSRPASLAPRVPRSYRVADGIGQQTDSLENLITGLGTAADKTTGASFVFNEMNKQQLEMAFRSDWIARKCITIPAADATRQWRSWKSDAKDIEVIEDVEKKLKLQSKLRSVMTKARLYGGAALLLGVDQGVDMARPLEMEKVGKDSLEFIHVLTKWELSAGELEYDIASENYGCPKYYTRASGDGSKIDPSRIIKFVGNEVPDPMQTMGWGDSILNVVQDAVVAAGLTCASGAQLVQETKMDVVYIPELTEALSNKDYESRLTKRFGLANQTKSLYNIMLLDAEEKWERITANFAGLPDVLKLYLMVASGAVDIPATRFLGQSPAGLSATGESDTRNYYDHVKAEQTTVYGVAMEPLDEILIRSSTGTKNPEDVGYEWNPLWQMSDDQKSTIMTQKANAFKVDHDTGLLPSEVLRDARINQLIEDGTYPGLEQILDDYGPLEPIDDNPEPGAVIGPDGKPISPTDPKHPANQPPKLGPDGKPLPPQPGPPKPIGDMARRVRLADPKNRKYQKMMDGVLRTLYVSRRVLNAGEIIKWAKAQGIPSLMPASELHVTICYTRTPIDWALTGEAWGQDEDGNMKIRPGGMRALQKFGNAVVLCFNSSDLAWRHCSLSNVAGATWDYAEYQPHVTLSYIGTEGEPFELEGIEAYQGAIELGPEVFEEANGNPMIADANGNPFFDNGTNPFSDYNENHDPANGEFTAGGGGGGAKEAEKSKEGKIKAGAKAARDAVKKVMTKEGAKAAIKAAVGKVNDNKLALINGAVQAAAYHGAGIDYGPDIENAIHHEIDHLATNAKIAYGMAKDYVQKSAQALVAYARGAKKATDSAFTADADDPAIVAFQNVIKACKAYKAKEE